MKRERVEGRGGAQVAEARVAPGPNKARRLEAKQKTGISKG